MKLHSTVGKARLYVGDALEVLKVLPPQSVQVCVTSPPYFGLRSYDAQAQMWGDGWKGQLGQEPTPILYTQHLVQIFQEVKRVLRDDGLLWVVIGDSLASGKGTCYNPGGGESSLGSYAKGKADGIYPLDRGNVSTLRESGLKPLDLIGVPWRLAFAMQDDGWFLRSAVVWSKTSSMPSSVNGWRWEQHRVKVAPSARAAPNSPHSMSPQGVNMPQGARDGRDFLDHNREYVECPGCPTCSPTGGYILRKGSWRPTSSYELIFMFSKTEDYYADKVAVMESLAPESLTRYKYKFGGAADARIKATDNPTYLVGERAPTAGRNKRDVWTLGPEPLPAQFRGEHFATFPTMVAAIPILASTSPYACPMCGAPWARVVDRSIADHVGDTVTAYAVGSNANRVALLRQAARKSGKECVDKTVTVGWLPVCACPDGSGSGSCTVLDIFGGTGTASLVANRLNLKSIYIDISTKYADLAKRRLEYDLERPEKRKGFWQGFDRDQWQMMGGLVGTEEGEANVGSSSNGSGDPEDLDDASA